MADPATWLGVKMGCEEKTQAHIHDTKLKVVGADSSSAVSFRMVAFEHGFSPISLTGTRQQPAAV